MQKILRKRIFRDLKENVFRYLALGFLIILGMYIVIGLVGAADTIIKGTAKTAKTSKVEDGQFGVFVPLTEKEKASIEKDGVTLEEHFYLDYTISDEIASVKKTCTTECPEEYGSAEGLVLRIFSQREKIDIVQVDCGRLPEKIGEILLEKRYCKEHAISVGDVVSVGNFDFTVVGIGTVPDYELPLRNFSDSAADSYQFGIGFVTKEEYKQMKNDGGSISSEEYSYAYLLNDKMSGKRLKEKLQDLEIAADDIDDAFFREYWKRTGGKSEVFKDSFDELADGAGELRDGLAKLDENSSTLAELEVFAGGVKEYTNGVSEAAKSAGELHDGVLKMREETEEFLDENFDCSLSKMPRFISAADNPRIGSAANDKLVDKASGLAAGVMVLILFAYVISVFTVHSIEKESGVIGTLYAMGVKKNELLRHYLTLPVIITLIAGVTGTALGYSSLGVNVQMSQPYGYFSIPKIDVIYEPYLLLYGLVMPPLAAVFINYLVIRKKLDRPALALIRGEQKSANVQNVRIKGGFVRVFRIRQLLREKRTAITVFFGMFISLLIVMLSLDCYVICSHIKTENVKDTKFEYMYTYKYPEENVPEGGEEAYGVTMKKEVLGYHFDVTLLGIHKDNAYFDAEVEKGENNVFVSSAMAQKYGIRTGDIVTLFDEENDKNYAFMVDGIVTYSAGFFVFMDIDSMRELMGESDDYYNIVFADHALDIDSGRLYSTLSKGEVEKSASVFVTLMKDMVTMLLVISVLMFMVVMYLMMKMMIDRSAMSISLFKVFGYQKREIGKLYLNGNFFVIVFGALVGIPLSKLVMDRLFPYMVSNVACGINLTFFWQIYVGCFLSVLVLYFIINRLLMHRVNKILPGEVLKNRE